jgi:dihydrodipicolinate synthase/N-acetylneuraminate lyase
MKIQWKGVMPAVTTKFTTQDELDIAMFGVNIKAQLEAGVHGIVLGGTLGEASTLSDDEKSVLTKETVRLVDRKVPVLINIAEQSTKGAIARNTKLPIMVYNNPVDYKIEVTLDMFNEILKYDNIQAVKESTRDISNVTRIKNAFGDRLKIMTGVDTLALESLLMGADGWVAGLVDAFPAETVAIYELQRVGRIQEAIAIYRWFLPLLELDINPKLVQNIKLAEVHTGIGTEHVRAPRLPLSGAERVHVLDVINKGIASRPKLPDYKNL